MPPASPPPRIAAAWRTVITPPLDGAHNMAVDAALMARANRTDEAVLRLYSWSAPTLSLGRNQTARGLYNLLRLRERGIGAVRRPTGGRAVLHHREVTYSVTAPATDCMPLRSTCSRINDLLLHALCQLGVAAAVVPRARRAPRPTAAPCFATPAEGELMVAGRKLVGSAQWRDGGAFLQHGSILLADDQSAISDLTAEPSGVTSPPATLTDLLGRTPHHTEVTAALVDAVLALEDGDARPLDADATIADARSLVHAFADDNWTWRR